MKIIAHFLFTILTFLLAADTLSQTSFKEIKVNQQRIESRIFEMSKFGKDSSSRRYRIAYSQGDLERRTWFCL